MKILVTGGTVFVSRYTAAYFVQCGHEVYVLNRGTRPQVEGVTLIRADRMRLDGCLSGMSFDAVLDICAYNQQDVQALLGAGFSFEDYILISSSAVYPETLPQPFREDQPVGPNRIWGAYGTDKIAAEQYLLSHFPRAYVLRPPYLYGPMQNLYREPFVFECAEQGRKFYLPGDGSMKLQFFHAEDLCRLMERILACHPVSRIMNVGNSVSVDIKTFVQLCYRAVGMPLETAEVRENIDQRKYFSFYNYEYRLDVTLQNLILPDQIDLAEGLCESYAWFREHREEVRRKPLMEYIDSQFVKV